MAEPRRTIHIKVTSRIGRGPRWRVEVGYSTVVAGVVYSALPSFNTLGIAHRAASALETLYRLDGCEVELSPAERTAAPKAAPRG